MFTESDEKRGLVKMYWPQVRERVKKVEPNFAKIVDELNPSKSFPLYLAYYPYGSIDADTQSSLFPTNDGNFFRLTDSNAPKDVICNLGYSKNNTPFGMVLDKQIECYIDLKNKKRIIPWCIYTPGKMFPFTRILSQRDARIYAPNGLLSSTAGSRSVFMLPNIGCETNHVNLKRDFKIKSSPPKSIYEHWNVFKEIINSNSINSSWRCCVMYFSGQWLKQLHNDTAWSKLKHYLYESAWHESEYDINRSHYDMIFSIIQQNRNLRPNPYLADTAKHLFTTAIGAAPGFTPALNEEALPLEELQKVFIDSYGLKKYIPTIMHPSHFNYEEDKYPIYYSLQNPSTHIFSPKSRVISSTLHEMRELEHIIKIFRSELLKENGLCSKDSILYKIASGTQFSYFHNRIDSHGIIKPSDEIFKSDKRFDHFHVNSKKVNDLTFAADATFVRGCISIRSNNQ